MSNQLTKKNFVDGGNTLPIDVCSIPTLVIYGPVKSASYVLGAGPDTFAIIGGLLEIIVALAGMGAAIVLFPMLKKQNESASVGLIAARVLESGTIFCSGPLSLDSHSTSFLAVF